MEKEELSGQATKKELDRLNSRVDEEADHSPAGYPENCSNCIHEISSGWCPEERREGDEKYGPKCRNWKYRGRWVPDMKHRKESSKETYPDGDVGREEADFKCTKCGNYLTKEQVESVKVQKCVYCDSRALKKLPPTTVRQKKAR